MGISAYNCERVDIDYSVQIVSIIFIVFGNFFSSFYTSSTRSNNYSMTKIFGNLSCADIVCRKIVYIYTFLDEKKKNFSVYCTPYRVHQEYTLFCFFCVFCFCEHRRESIRKKPALDGERVYFKTCAQRLLDTTTSRSLFNPIFLIQKLLKTLKF